MSEGAQPRVAVVVLNWQGSADTIRCVESLLASDYAGLSIVIVDNGSADDSVEAIRTWGREAAQQNPRRPAFTEHAIDPVTRKAPAGDDCPTGAWCVTLLKNAENEGFARGNNHGIRFALAGPADFVFVLNNDAVVREDCMRTLVDFAQSHPDAAMLGPRTYDMGTEHYRQWCMRTPLTFFKVLFTVSPLRRLVYGTPLFESFYYQDDEPARVYAVPGSAMFFRRAALEAIGLYDEYTFIYWEEYIVAHKMLQHGLHTYVVPQAVIWHDESATIRKIGARKFIENVRSERYFYRRYMGLNGVQRAVLGGIRLASYLARTAVDRSYREQLGAFWREFTSTRQPS